MAFWPILVLVFRKMSGGKELIHDYIPQPLDLNDNNSAGGSDSTSDECFDNWVILWSAWKAKYKQNTCRTTSFA